MSPSNDKIEMFFLAQFFQMNTVRRELRGLYDRFLPFTQWNLDKSLEFWRGKVNTDNMVSSPSQKVYRSLLVSLTSEAMSRGTMIRKLSGFFIKTEPLFGFPENFGFSKNPCHWSVFSTENEDWQYRNTGRFDPMFRSSSHLGPNQTSDLNKVKLCVYTIESLLRITLEEFV